MKLNGLKQALAGTLMVMMVLPLSAMAVNAASPDKAPCKVPGQHCEARQNSIFSQLNLSDDQKAKVKALMDAQNNKNRAERQALWSKHQQMMQLIKSDNSNRNQALALHREIAQRQGVLMESRINFLYDLKDVLTPEQFEKASQLMKQQAFGHRGGFRSGKGRPGSPAGAPGQG